jgi:hypothetical protein
MEMNGGAVPETPQVALQPIATTIPTDSCSLGVVEERDPLTGRSYRDLVVLYPNGFQYNLRFFDLERARQIGRALIKHTPQDERGVGARTPLQDMARKLAEEGK